MIKRELNSMQGERLKECLKDKRMTQKELSEKSSYTPQHINNIIGGTRNMSLESAEKFAKILEVERDYLLCQSNCKTHADAVRSEYESLDACNEAVIALLKFAGVHIAGSFYEEDGKKFYSAGHYVGGKLYSATPKFFMPPEIAIKRTAETSGKYHELIQHKVYVEVLGEKKEIPQDVLNYLYEDIMDYVEFKCGKFKDEYFSKK